jgi:hypothetical protein
MDRLKRTTNEDQDEFAEVVEKLAEKDFRQVTTFNNTIKPVVYVGAGYCLSSFLKDNSYQDKLQIVIPSVSIGLLIGHNYLSYYDKCKTMTNSLVKNVKNYSILKILGVTCCGLYIIKSLNLHNENPVKSK